MSVIQVRSITCLMRCFRSPAGTPLILATNVRARDGHVRVERRRFGQVAGAPFRFDRLIEHVEARDDGLAVGGRHVAGENPHGGRLAGAVRPEKSRISPRSTRKLTSSTAVTRPYRFVRCWTSIKDRSPGS